ncbi:SGNH/GDSL hydrolase family protein [Flavihumibacter fluvii]|uniref:SGNH/GDSL hydrolase family protein n=1 Tax=Flavihumibacter fluvii TaxID=2838157 RepID=UPI001BDE18BC|nr:SGNH/GDSL hydrolase family protein [Flavihumibacter fluvii]ULQ54628.1 SGNH/GDSL hydrolase family protein [Flavihumibacter fluvii]
MRNSILVCLLLFLGICGQCQPNYSGKPFPAKVKRILFLGNSITYKGDYITDIEAYIILHFPKKQYEFINVGLPSETVSGLSEVGHADGAFPRPDLHERLARVLALTKPDLVFANYGMNDGIYQPLDDRRFQLFREGITWLHDYVIKFGAKIIHLTPPIYDEKKGGVKGYNKVLDAYSNWLMSQRDSLGWEVADIHFPMLEFQLQRQVADPDFSLAGDGVHPDEMGHWIMAKQVLLYLEPNNDLIAADGIKSLMAKNKNGLQIFSLINERQQMMKDAWLTATRHTRPGMNSGMPLDDAKKEAIKIENLIRELLLEKN